MFKIIELEKLAPMRYYDAVEKIQFECYADTFVYHKTSGNGRNLVAMRFGGYPESVRGMLDALNNNAGVETVIDGKI